MEPKSTHEFSIAPADVAHEFAHPLPPVAARKPVEHRLHGDLRVDDYAWLREKDNPDVIRHLEAENAYTKAVLQPTEAFQEKLYQEMLSRIQQTDLTVPYQLRGYTLGEPGPAPLLIDETDERFRIEIARTRSGAYLMLLAASHTTSEVRYLSAGDPSGEFQLIAPREDAHEYYADHHPKFAAAQSDSSSADVFLIRTNSGGRTFRLVAAPIGAPQRSNWQELIPNRPAVMLSAALPFRSYLVLFEREDGLPFLRVIPLLQHSNNLLEASYRIKFDEPAYNAAPGMNPEFEQAHFRYSYESFVTPRSIFDFDVSAQQSTLRKQQPILGGYDATLYTSQRLRSVAPDGTRIPLSIVYRKDTPRDGAAPLLLYGYGSYGISMPVNFSSNRLSLLDRGVIYAVAHIRGGGELGKPWHDAGRLHQKRNTFTDFIAAAEHLIAQCYTAPEKLVIEGGSAGGRLMGAVTNMRPDLFRMVINRVPFVDVLNTMLDASL